MNLRRVFGGSALLVLGLAALPPACGLSALEIVRRRPAAPVVSSPPPAGARAVAIGSEGGRRRVWVVAIDGLSSREWQRHWDARPFASLRGILEQGVGTLAAQVGGGPERCGPDALFDTTVGWTNVFTGVDCAQHGVASGGQKASFYRTRREFPTFFWSARQRLGLRTAAVAGPGVLSESKRGEPDAARDPLAIEGERGTGESWSNLDFRRSTGGIDALAVEYTLEALFEWDVDVMLTHFDEVDHIGHMLGWGSRGWLDRLERTDRRVGSILAAIRGDASATQDAARAARRRAEFAQEDWLVVVTSDHGGHATPGCRGLDCCVPGFGRCGRHDRLPGADDRVPLLMASLGGRATPLEPLRPPVSQMDVHPTVLAWLGGEEADTGRVAGHVQGVPREQVALVQRRLPDVSLPPLSASGSSGR